MCGCVKKLSLPHMSLSTASKPTQLPPPPLYLCVNIYRHIYIHILQMGVCVKKPLLPHMSFSTASKPTRSLSTPWYLCLNRYI